MRRTKLKVAAFTISRKFLIHQITDIRKFCRSAESNAGAEIAGFICPGSASAARSHSVGVNAIKTVVVFVATGVK